MSSISSFLTSIRFKFQDLIVWSNLLIIFLSIENSQNVEIVPAIVGGQDADIKDYPFVVSIRRFGTHYCGGSIVNTRFVLTAGHCIFNQTKETIDVRTGASQLDSTLWNTYAVEDIRLHPDYEYVTDKIAENDIGVLKVDRSIDYSGKPLSFERVYIERGARGFIIGWGRQKFEEGPSNQLQQLKVLTINNERCQRLAPQRYLNDGNLCTAPMKKRGACYGDSGSPLVEASNHYNQIGLLSWVHGECATDQPDGYTRISPFVSWIKDVTSDV